MNILHLSDLHFSKRNYHQINIIQGPLLKDLQLISDLGLKPDILVFTGDLVNDPDEEEVYVHLISYITEIMGAAALDEKRVVILPGNHDVSRSFLQKEYLQRENLRSAPPQRLDELYQSGELQTYLRATNKPFFDFAELFSRGWNDPVYSIHQFPQFNLSVLALNSTCNCSLHGSNDDRDRLSIPRAAIEKALSEIPADQIVVSLMHHPFSYLRETAGAVLLPLIDAHASATFLGTFTRQSPQYK